ncbi:hypothetical protein ACIHFC_32900 [Streptomyces sp. NPDC052013]|uniref:hypothetical protein n=1 Tax=Streptomyces sp. NPDC052013 TaxID=3365679 RepID=UPI0037D566C1
MPYNDEDIRIQESEAGDVWPARAQRVSHVGGACVVHGSGDFSLADLHTVRARFPGRHVTLDGDVITIWPPARHDE